MRLYLDVNFVRSRILERVDCLIISKINIRVNTMLIKNNREKERNKSDKKRNQKMNLETRVLIAKRCLYVKGISKTILSTVLNKLRKTSQLLKIQRKKKNQVQKINKRMTILKVLKMSLTCSL